MEEKLIKRDIIEKIYQSEEKNLDQLIIKINKNTKNKLKNIDRTKILENTNNKKEIIKMLEDIEENYNIKIGEYIKEFYKQGFIDGINLMLNCLN